MLLSAVFILFGLAACAQAISGDLKTMYPKARRDISVVDNYNGTKVMDPYRWLENSSSNETIKFVKAQNEVSRKYFDACSSRSKIEERLNETKRYSKYDLPQYAGGKYFYVHNTGHTDQDVLYMQDSLDSGSTVFLDPNKLSEDGSQSLDDAEGFSKNGQMYAYSLSKDKSAWVTIKVRVVNGTDLKDMVKNVKHSEIAWTPDNKGFFYSGYSAADRSDTGPLSNHSVFYHSVGTDQDQDTLIFRDPSNPAYLNKARTSNDGRYLVLRSLDGRVRTKVYIADLQSFNKDEPLVFNEVVDKADDMYWYVTNVGSKFFFITNKDAPFQKLITITITINNHNHNHKQVTVVQENSTKGLLKHGKSVKEKIILHYIQDAKSELYIHNMHTGKEEHKVQLELGSVGEMSRQITNTSQLLFPFESFLEPSTIYILDVDTSEATVWKQGKVSGFQPEDFETRQLFFSSEDNTTVPMFVVHKKNMELMGNHPLLLFGFGGFRQILTPTFKPEVLVFLDNLGGVYAMANIRGGLEYGDDWYKAGIREKKQNSFDDFQAAAKFLIKRKYTNSQKLAIYGRGNGAMVVGACLNQKPELFAAGVLSKGMLDMLRYQEFIDHSHWNKEYGSPDNSTQFDWLYRYSPLHNIPTANKLGEKPFPATLVMTPAKYDALPPVHSLKYTAQLQFSLGDNQTNPLLLRVDTRPGKTTYNWVQEHADFYSFLDQNLDLTWKD